MTIRASRDSGKTWGRMDDLTTVPAESVPEDLRELVASWRDPFSFSNRAYAVTDPPEIDFDSTEVQAAELPASNGIGTAHALARMYAALIGEVDGVRLPTPETLPSDSAPATRCLRTGRRAAKVSEPMTSGSVGRPSLQMMLLPRK